jgi:Tol biopolymer transport system component
MMNADGSNAHALTEYEGKEMFPYWAPDGKTLIFL